MSISTNILDMELDLIDVDFFSHPSGGTGRNVIIFNHLQRFITGKKTLFWVKALHKD